MNQKFRTCAASVMLLGWLLGFRGGKLTLWHEGSTHPEQIYDIREDSLPPADRLRLRQGIRVESREALWLLLENYLE